MAAILTELAAVGRAVQDAPPGQHRLSKKSNRHVSSLSTFTLCSQTKSKKARSPFFAFIAWCFRRIMQYHQTS